MYDSKSWSWYYSSSTLQDVNPLLVYIYHCWSTALRPRSTQVYKILHPTSWSTTWVFNTREWTMTMALSCEHILHRVEIRSTHVANLDHCTHWHLIHLCWPTRSFPVSTIVRKIRNITKKPCPNLPHSQLIYFLRVFIHFIMWLAFCCQNVHFRGKLSLKSPVQDSFFIQYRNSLLLFLIKTSSFQINLK